MVKKKAYRALIDTMQLGIGISNCDIIAIKNKDNVYNKAINNNKKLRLSDSKVSIIVKVHNLYKIVTKEYYVESFKDQINIVNNILESIGVGDMNKIEYQRIDVAIDMPNDFTEVYKKIDYLFDLLACKSSGKKFFNTDKVTRKVDCIRLLGRSWDMCFYDKKAESKGNSDYDTRLEFRFKRFKMTSLADALEKLLEFINNIEDNIDYVENKQIVILKNMWDERENKKVRLSEFIRVNEKMIFTNKIMKELYSYVGLKSNYKVWLDNFRKDNRLDFVSKTELKTIKKDIIREIKRYKKS